MKTAPSTEQDWENATWEGSRRAQLRASLKLTHKERFEAMQDLQDTSQWLASAKKMANLKPGSGYQKD